MRGGKRCFQYWGHRWLLRGSAPAGKWCSSIKGWRISGSNTWGALRTSSLHFNSTSPSFSKTEKATISAQESAVEAFKTTFFSLLHDRRICYRDSVVLERLKAAQANVSNTVRSSLNPSQNSSFISVPELINHFNSETGVPEKQSRSLGASDAHGASALLTDAHVESDGGKMLDVMVSGLLPTFSDLDAYVRIAEQRTCPSSEGLLVYARAIQGLVLLAAADGSPSGASASTVFGEAAQLNRTLLGEQAGWYMGRALKAWERAPRTKPEAVSRLVDAMDEVWSSFFTVCCIAQVATKLLDLWWKKMNDFYDEIQKNQSQGLSSTTSPLPAAVPYEAVLGLLSSTADESDIERCFHVFREANNRGMRVICVMKGEAPPSEKLLLPPGRLLVQQKEGTVQCLQLALLAKLMTSSKSVTADGGVRELVVKDLQRLISPETLLLTPWEIINDVLVGLSVSSAMQLVKARSTKEGDGQVPFFIWASLLRRCARDQRIDEADALFFYIRKRFTLSSHEKEELYTIMIRMHATLTPPNASFALHLFLEYSRSLGPDEGPSNRRLTHDWGQLYTLLIRSADSRNAKMMYFLEACAAGTVLTHEVFETLMGTHSPGSLRALTRRLPHEYTSSPLDAMIRIPSNIDAHLRREEAQLASGKSPVDSTGDPV